MATGNLRRCHPHNNDIGLNNDYRRQNVAIVAKITVSICELFEMADKIEAEAKWFQPLSFPHFDVPKFRRKEAISNGAVSIERRDMAHFMRSYRRNLQENSIEREILKQLSATPSFHLAKALNDQRNQR